MRNLKERILGEILLLEENSIEVCGLKRRPKITTILLSPKAHIDLILEVKAEKDDDWHLSRLANEGKFWGIPVRISPNILNDFEINWN